MTLSPYAKPGFYEDALAKGRHRDIVGGRWEETGDTVIPLLFDLGLRRSDRFLDIGAGALRLGCRIIPELPPGHYWATDASGALMRRGWEVELTPDQQARLPLDQLIEDAEFRFPGVPTDIDFALCFAVFTHLPLSSLRQGLAGVRARFPALRRLLFTVFLATDEAAFAAPYRQRDGVVTHPDRTPWHHLAGDVVATAVMPTDRQPSSADNTISPGAGAVFSPKRCSGSSTMVTRTPRMVTSTSTCGPSPSTAR